MRSTFQIAEQYVEPKIQPLQPARSRRESTRYQWRLYTISLVMNDIAMMSIAFWLAYFVRFNLSLSIFQVAITPSPTFYLRLMIALVPLWVIIFALSGLYSLHNLLGGTREYARVFNATSIGALSVIVITFLEPFFILARGWLLLSWALGFFFTALGRFVLRRIVYSLREEGYFLRPAILVGSNEEARLLAEQLMRWKTSGLYLLGFVDHDRSSIEAGGKALRHLGRMEELHGIVQAADAEELIIATSALTRHEMLEIFRQFGVSERVKLRLSSGLFEIITTGIEVNELGYVPLVSINKVRLTGIDQILKFMLDYALTIPGLIALFPAFLIIAIAIRLDSPGPIFHRRRVMGVNGREFDAFKFRTMHVNGDEILQQHPELLEELEHNHKLKDDPRVTRIGRLLRKFSLDELPQLLNVLRAEMSLVGPRMISPAEMAKYNKWGINLLTVRPGITGLWQVSGRSDLTYEDRVRLDMNYIRNWTIWLDLQLLLQTFPAVFRGHGAY